MRFNHCFILLFSWVLSNLSFGQQLNLPLHTDFTSKIENSILSADSIETFHSSLRPYTISQLPQVSKSTLEDTNKYYYTYTQKIYKENLVIIQDSNVYITIDPLVQFQLLRDSDTLTRNNQFFNSRGVLVNGSIGKRFSFSSSFQENQAFFPTYINNFIASRSSFTPNGASYTPSGGGVVPGQGRTKVFKDDGYDFSIARGYIAYSPAKNWQTQFGNGKHFIGNGYRSLLLSDNSFSYTYFQNQLSLFKNKIQFTSIWNGLNRLYRLPKGDTPEAGFEYKNGTFHYLSWKPNNSFELGILESTIWQRIDSTGITTYPYQQLIPVPLLSLVSNGFSSKHNVLLGLNLNYTGIKRLSIYGQLVIDNLKKKQSGVQLGIKKYFGKNIYLPSSLQIEFNSVRPFTYSHVTPLQNYSHYNQEISHPYGAAFQELIVTGQISIDRFSILTRNTYSSRKQSDTTNVGSNIFESYPSMVTNLTDTRRKLWFNRLEVSYHANIKTNLKIYVGLTNRYEKNLNASVNSTFLYLGLKTELSNYYNDF